MTEMESKLKALTRHEMAALDKAMVEFGIDVGRMMELAGLEAAFMAGQIGNGSSNEEEATAIKKIIIM